MFTADKHIVQDSFANITDYSAVCPKGMKCFFAYAHFTDFSNCLLSNIFAADRGAALQIVLDRFADCINYLSGISLHASDD